MINWRTWLEFIVRSFFYSLIIFLIDTILIIVINGGFNQIYDTLSFVLLIEGGICLVVGGAWHYIHHLLVK